MPENFSRLNARVAIIATCLSRNKGLIKAVCGIILLAWLQGSMSLFAVVVPPATYSVTLGWETAQGPVAGYQIWYGTASQNYSTNIYVGNVTTATVTGLSPGVTYYFVVTDYDTSGNGSIASSEVSYTPGTPLAEFQGLVSGLANLTLKGLIGHTYEIQATQDLQSWTVIGTVTLGALGSGSFTDVNAGQFSKQFYRTHDITP
jgi:hypothetical protein